MLQLIIDWFTFSLFGMDPLNAWAQGINFFIYESIKILLLLFVLISVIGFLRSFLPIQEIKRRLCGRSVFPYLFSSAFGALTPFCSCSSIPIFISFLEAGVPLGVTFSFLVTSPLVNEYLVVLMLGFFGFKITVFYVLSGITIGVICGVVMERMKLDRYLESDLVKQDAVPGSAENAPQDLRGRVFFGIGEAVSIVKKLWLWVLFGVGLGALIHNFVPQEVVRVMVSRTGFLDVPLAALIGIPMYGSCAAIVPIAVALFQKGFPLGTALAFMMAVSALSLPEAVMLRRAMRLKLIGVFFAITAAGIILTGYLFNFLQKVLI